MATQIKPTTKNSPRIEKQGKKFNGTATEYAPPHTMDDKPVNVVNEQKPTKSNDEHLRNANVSVAWNRSNEYPETKITGIKMRGTGAATKGLMSRGPMG
jgi:hypothetical protein